MVSSSKTLACGVLALLLAGTAARADGRLGLGWEDGIEAGIARQERERKQRPAEALLRDAKLAAGRQVDGPERIVRLYLLARAYGIAGDPDSAKSVYTEALRAEPRLYFAYHDLAMLALGRDPPDEQGAERDLRRAIGINPDFLTAQRKLAVLLLRMKRTDEAVGFLRRIVDGDPGDPQARYLLAHALVQAERLDAAEAEIEQLLEREPRNDTYRMLLGAVLIGRGDAKKAFSVYRGIATRNPQSRDALAGCLHALDRMRDETGSPDTEDYLWALEGLLRLETDSARREKLREAIDQVRKAAAGGATGGEGPPSDADLASRLPQLEPERRVAALKYVYVRKDAPSPDLLRTVIGRLSPSAEPDPRARVWALRILGRFGGYGLVGLVRHSLADPAVEVRPIAADALVELAETDPSAHAVAVLALGRVAGAEDPLFGPAARANLGKLAGATFPAVADASPEAKREAFLRWWQGPRGVEVRRVALSKVGGLRDPAADSLLLPYLRDTDPGVRRAAWKALWDERTRLLGTTGLDAARRAWLQAMPPYREEADVVAQAPRLEQWAAARPR